MNSLLYGFICVILSILDLLQDDYYTTCPIGIDMSRFVALRLCVSPYASREGVSNLRLRSPRRNGYRLREDSKFGHQESQRGGV